MKNSDVGVDGASPADEIRRQIREEILAVKAFDDLERQHLAEALCWLDSGAGLFRLAKPAVPPIHLVAYFAVVDVGHILLIDHKQAELWLPTGGHVENGEHPRQTVVRELQEELGITAPHAISAPLMVTRTTTVGLTAGHIDISLWYVVHVSRTQSLQLDANEFHAARWFPFAELPAGRTDPHLPRFVAKLASLIPT